MANRLKGWIGRGVKWRLSPGGHSRNFLLVLATLIVGVFGDLAFASERRGVEGAGAEVPTVIFRAKAQPEEVITTPVWCDDFSLNRHLIAKDFLPQSYLAFLGQARETADGVTRFEIVEPFKGPSPGLAFIYHTAPAGPCGGGDWVFVPGQSYLVFANAAVGAASGGTIFPLRAAFEPDKVKDLLAEVQTYRTTRIKLEAESRQSEAPEAQLELARHMEAFGETEAAEAQYQRALTLDRGIEALVYLGRIALCDGRAEAAYDFASRAISRDPKSTDAIILRDISANATGRPLDLTKADLSGAPGPGCTKSRGPATVKLEGRNALGLRAVNAALTFTDARGADLSNADLAGATIRGDLSGASFHGADLAGTHFGGLFAGADFSGVVGGRLEIYSDKPSRGARFTDSDLSEGHFLRSFPSADFSGANLTRASLFLGEFEEAQFARAQLASADLGRSDLRGSNFAEAKLIGAKMGFSDLRGADFNGADLTGAILTGSNLSGAHLDQTVLRTARLDKTTYDCTTTWPSGFDPVAAGAVLKPGPDSCPRPAPGLYAGQDLSSLDFRGEDLSGIDFSQTRLCGTRFEGANLARAVINEATSFCPPPGLDLRLLEGAILDNAALADSDLVFFSSPGDEDFKPPRLRGTDLRHARIKFFGAPVGPAMVAALAEADTRGAIINCGSSDVASTLDPVRLHLFFNRSCGEHPTSGVSAVDLAGKNLPEINLRGMNLQGADLRNADLRKADLRETDFRGQDLSDANLVSADLRDAQAAGAILRHTNLAGAVLSRADLRAADLSQANLGGADLSGADLRAADLSEAVLGNANLRGADLRGAKLERKQIESVRWTFETRWPERIMPEPPPGSCTARSANDPTPAYPRLLHPLLLGEKQFYPRASILLHEQGTVALYVRVAPTGHVMDACMGTSGRARLDDAALEFARTGLRFAPLQEKVSAWTALHVRFELQ